MAERRGPRPEYWGLIRVEVQVFILKDLVYPSHYTLGGLVLMQDCPRRTNKRKVTQ